MTVSLLILSVFSADLPAAWHRKWSSNKQAAELNIYQESNAKRINISEEERVDKSNRMHAEAAHLSISNDLTLEHLSYIC